MRQRVNIWVEVGDTFIRPGDGFIDSRRRMFSTREGTRKADEKWNRARHAK